MDLNEQVTVFLKDFLAGGFSGIVAKTVVAPVERIKLLLQTQKVNSRISQTKIYSGGLQCFRDIVEKEGMLALWRGNTANVIRYFPNQAFNFALKDKFRRFLGMSTTGDGGQRSMSMHVVLWNNMIAGSAAGATTSLITYPLDMARTRLATDVAIVGGGEGKGKGQRQFVGVWDCVKQSYVEGGLPRVYRGFPLSVCGGLFFGGYDNLKHVLALHEASFLERYVVAQLLTTVVGTICYPIDTIKRRMMIQTNFDRGGSSFNASGSVSKGPMNARECFRHVMRTEGFRGLYSGLGINLVRGVSGALLLVCYDEAKKITHKDEKS